MTAAATALLERSPRRVVRTGRGPNTITDEHMDGALMRFAHRPLRHISFPYVEIQIGSRRGAAGTESPSAVVSAIGLRSDGRIEALGFAVGDVEDRNFWLEFFHDLRTRGLHGVRMIAGPDQRGLREASATMFPDAAVRTIRPRPTHD